MLSEDNETNIVYFCEFYLRSIIFFGISSHHDITCHLPLVLLTVGGLTDSSANRDFLRDRRRQFTEIRYLCPAKRFYHKLAVP